MVEDESCYVITATLVETALLTWWLRGFGDAVSDVFITPLDEIQSPEK